MKSIDIHAHLVPASLWRAAEAGREWHGFRHEPGDGLGTFLGTNGKRTGFTSPKVRLTPEERLADMDAQGVDMQVVSIHTPLFGYHLEPPQGLALAREVNDEIAGMTRTWPTRFTGLATLPVQDVKAAIAELERAVTVLGLKGAELDTLVNGENWDEPRFLPLFKAAEAMGAVLFFHPQPQQNFMVERAGRYGLFNSLGVIVEDAIVVAVLILGGILEACPDLKACIAHGGGPACYAMGRLDRGWQGTPAARVHIPTPPSSYQKRLYYDTVVGSEAALRFLLDQVGADRVVLGSDWPFVPWHPSPVTWLQGLTSVSPAEKEQILHRNLEGLLGLLVSASFREDEGRGAAGGRLAPLPRPARARPPPPPPPPLALPRVRLVPACGCFLAEDAGAVELHQGLGAGAEAGAAAGDGGGLDGLQQLALGGAVVDGPAHVGDHAVLATAEGEDPDDHHLAVLHR